MTIFSPCGHSNDDHARFCAACGRAIEPPSSDDPLIGAVIAQRYRVTRVIGEGGMGRVYFAEQTMGGTSRPVAVKVMTGGHTDPLALARFYRECETIVQLSHPSTIRCYDFGALDLPLPSGGRDTRLYLAMEYVDGRTLASAIAEGPIPWPEAVRLLRQVGQAIAEAHQRGIVHRDLKPENILLARDTGEGERAKVLDFGIARDAGASAELTAEGLIVGTPAYMSPEQIQGLPVDARSDVYALGLIAFEMVTGARAFAASTPLQWATAHVESAPRSFDDFPGAGGLPAALRAAIVSALAKEPQDRPPSMRAFVEALGPASEDPRRAMGDATPPPPGVPAPSDAHTAQPSVRRGRGLSPTAGALLVGTVVGLGGASVWLMLPGTHPAPPSPASAATALDAGAPPVDAGPAEAPHRWLRNLQYENRTDDATAALGPPDGRCAVLRAGGTITLELSPDQRLETDGSPAADLFVELGADPPSGPYRVDVGVERHQYTTVAAGLIGSSPLDVDQHGIARFRYVRIKNRDRTTALCIDAVGSLEAPPPGTHGVE